MKYGAARRFLLEKNGRLFSTRQSAIAMAIALILNGIAVLLDLVDIGIDDALKRQINLALIFFSFSALIFSIYSEVKRAIDHVILVSQGGFENRFVGLSHELMNVLGERLARAVNVKNTFIDHREITPGRTSNPYSFYWPSRISLYRTFFGAKGKLWIDVISRTTVLKNPAKFAECRRNIEAAAYKHKETGGDYKVLVLTQALPAVNFMILEYAPDEEREVLWGWGFHSQEPSAAVFHTRDDRVVAYFDKLFVAMENDASENLDDPRLSAYFEQRWMGAWVEKGDEGEQRESWAVRIIKFDQFQIRVDCAVFDGKGERNRSYETRNVTIDRDAISITFDARVLAQPGLSKKPAAAHDDAAGADDDPALPFSPTTRRGFARYEMDSPTDTTQFVASKSREYSGFVILTPAKKGAPELVKVVGRRVQSGNLNELFSGPSQLSLSAAEMADMKQYPQCCDPVYLDRLLDVLSEMEPGKRLKWLNKAFSIVQDGTSDGAGL